MKADIVIIGGAGHIGLPLGILFANKGKSVILYDKDEKYAMFYRMATFNDIEYYYWFEGDKDLTKVKWIASSCRIQTFKKKVLIMPKEVWSFGGKVYKAGSLLS